MKNKLLNILLILLCLSSYSCNLNCDSLTDNLNKNVLGKKCDLKDDTGRLFSNIDDSSSGTSSDPINDPINATFYTKTTSDGLGYNTTRGAYVDGSGNIYVATSGGLSISN